MLDSLYLSPPQSSHTLTGLQFIYILFNLASPNSVWPTYAVYPPLMAYELPVFVILWTSLLILDLRITASEVLSIWSNQGFIIC